jgi:hypothetical protein
MIELSKIELSDVERLVILSYNGDKLLFEKYHIKPMPLEGCVTKTMEMIREMDQLVKMEYFEVRRKGKPIGYVARFDQFLYSYAIGMKYRKVGILKEWWNKVVILMGPMFKTALYENNHRAIAFLINNGLRMTEKKGNVITFINTY